MITRKQYPNHHVYEMEIGGRPFTVETGKVAELANAECICRYGDITLPMDEALILSAVDVSGRGGFYGDLSIPSQKVGSFDTELCREFWIAFAREAGITLHIRQFTGDNSHHIIEGTFKATARALAKAVLIDEKFASEIPSTKGMLG